MISGTLELATAKQPWLRSSLAEIQGYLSLQPSGLTFSLVSAFQ
jgi:hypothetical protein